VDRKDRWSRAAMSPRTVQWEFTGSTQFGPTNGCSPALLAARVSAAGNRAGSVKGSEQPQ